MAYLRKYSHLKIEKKNNYVLWIDISNRYDFLFNIFNNSLMSKNINTIWWIITYIFKLHNNFAEITINKTFKVNYYNIIYLLLIKSLNPNCKHIIQYYNLICFYLLKYLNEYCKYLFNMTNNITKHNKYKLQNTGSIQCKSIYLKYIE